ncbi:MAG: polysaccharide biosynthesis protein, partial [Candidatus Heimdallarchaeota archaeon]|nr:polysaccharide biosynthesis protein [Candidatus Heimdallarchaeota archaeon]MCK4254323.1 polysaccharide biosynthesis protein [Candidatus Heimdallarchaeota archaeon]
KEVLGIEVVGKISDIQSMHDELVIDLFIIAIPSADGSRINEIVNIITETNKNFMIVPPIFNNLDINRISYPRKVDINDLIRRPIRNVLNQDSIDILKDSTVLITGASGSIGSEICVQLAISQPKKIIGIDIAETPLFNIINTMKDNFPNIEFIPILGNIRNKTKLEEIFKKYKPNIVYHCATFKHVKLMEDFPEECVLNNIFGTLNVIETAIKFKTDRFVFVSTDKAVEPTCIMGASKRVMEKYVLSLENKETAFMIVRFGNVLESNGSAIHIFKEQIKRGGPITITDLKMERYFMTITEAAQLVIQASILGEGNELFILDMGKPYKIVDIVKHLVKIYGYSEDSIPIEIIGAKQGEKLTEKLFYDFEKLAISEQSRIYICETSLPHNPEKYKQEVHNLVERVKVNNKENIREEIFKLVEYH